VQTRLAVQLARQNQLAHQVCVLIILLVFYSLYATMASNKSLKRS
jgi:uncharacterized membrane protein YobD (UPF0266 family)